MEVTIDTYTAPVDPDVPVVCMDEAGTALQGDVRDPLPVRPGDVARQDPEYTRHGSATLFMLYAPHLGWRHVRVTEQRTAVDWALTMRELVDVHFPAADRIVVVLDNLNTHRLSSLYTALPAAEAHRIARKLELRFTPRHGSWLNMAELDLAVLTRQCLDRRLPDRATLAAEIAAWETARNAAAAPARWTFPIDEARTRLTHLYPVPICDTTTESHH